MVSVVVVCLRAMARLRIDHGHADRLIVKLGKHEAQRVGR